MAATTTQYYTLGNGIVLKTGHAEPMPTQPGEVIPAVPEVDVIANSITPIIVPSSFGAVPNQSTLPTTPVVSFVLEQSIRLYEISILPILPPGATMYYYAQYGPYAIASAAAPAGCASAQNFRFPLNKKVILQRGTLISLFAYASTTNVLVQIALLGEAV